MGRSLRLACLAALLAASPVVGQQSWGSWTPGAGAFGYFTWGPPVANLGALPSCVASLTDHARVVSDTGSGDDGLYLCDGATWGEVGGGGTLAGDVDGPAGSNDLDEAAVESELEGVLDVADLQGASNYALLSGATFTGVVGVDNAQGFRLLEADAGGSNYVEFVAPAALTGNTTCTLENDSSPIPDSCVGDGTDGGGIGGSTGANANRILRSDGTGGATLQPSSVAINDDGDLTMPSGQSIVVSGALDAIISSDGTVRKYMFGSDEGWYDGANWMYRLRDEGSVSSFKLPGQGWMCFTQGDPFGSACTTTLSQPALGVLAIGTTDAHAGFAGTLKYAGDIVGGTSGATMAKTYVTELLTLNTGATTTATAANLAPANSEILAITYRITTTITTAVSFDVRVTGGNAFVNIGTATSSQTGMTAGTTGVLVPAAYGEGYRSTATTLTVTTNANPGAGVIRLTVFYRQFTPATS